MLISRRRRIGVSAGTPVADHLAYTTAPGLSGASPYTLSPQPVVAAKKADGSTDTTYAGTVTVSLVVLTGSPVLSGTTTKALASGVADFSANALVVTGAGTWQLQASLTGLASATSSTGTTTGAGGIALVSHTAKGGNATFSTTAIDTTGATLLIAVVTRFNGVGAPTLSDSKGNTWAPLTEYASNNQVNERIFYCASPTVGSGHTATLTGSGSFGVVAFSAWSGTLPATAFQVENGATPVAANTTIQPGSVTPAASGYLVITSLGTETAQSQPTIDSGFTVLDYVNLVGGSNEGGAVAYLIQSVAAAVNPTWTHVSEFAATGIAVFKHA